MKNLRPIKNMWFASALVLTLLVACADGEGSKPTRRVTDMGIDVPGTAIENRSTLAYAVGQLRVHVNGKYDCGALNIVGARRLTAVGNKGEFAEEWEADVCGVKKRFIMNFLNDMTGGAVLMIRE
jgi:hypothetical protein